MKPFTIYARREPTTAVEMPAVAPTAKHFDTVYYVDRRCARFYARRPWYQSGHHNRRSKHVTLNCYQWRLVLLPRKECKP